MKEHPVLFSGPMVRAILGGWKSQTRRPIVGSGPDTGDIRFDLESGEWYCEAGSWHAKCPLGSPGDRLWVRETWQAIHVFIDPETGYGDDMEWAKTIPKDPRRRGVHPDEIVMDFDTDWWQVVYAASDPDADLCQEDRGFPWRPSLHMPRWASRLILEITYVGVERLQDISMAAATSEGIYETNLPPTRMIWYTAQPELSAADRINHKDKTLAMSPVEAFEKLWSQTYQEGPGCWEENPWTWVIGFRVVEKKERR